MHTHKSHGHTSHYDGGFDGKVIITDDNTRESLEVDFQHIKSLVAKYVRNCRIDQLEQMSDDELLITSPPHINRQSESVRAG